MTAREDQPQLETLLRCPPAIRWLQDQGAVHDGQVLVMPGLACTPLHPVMGIITHLNAVPSRLTAVTVATGGGRCVQVDGRVVPLLQQP